MRVDVVRLSFLAILISTLLSCAPGLGKTISINQFPQVLATEDVPPAVLTRGEDPLNFVIQDVVDLRDQREVASINGRTLLPREDVSGVVTGALEEEFQRSGAHIASAGGAPVLGKIKKWNVEVVPGFPTSLANASAALEIEVLSTEGSVVYRGTFSGNAIAEHPFMSEKRIENTLASAMTYAIRAAIEDENFRLALLNAEQVAVY